MDASKSKHIANDLEIRFHAGGEDKWTADVALVPFWEGENLRETCAALYSAAPFLEIAPGMRDVTGRKGEINIVYGHPELPYSRVMFIGMGKDSHTEPNAMDILRAAYANGLRKARGMHFNSVHIPWSSLDRFGNAERVLEEAVYACVLANYQSARFKKTTREDLTPGVEWLAVGFTDKFVPENARQAARRGERAALTVIRARKLASAPGNVLNPVSYAEKAMELAKENGLSCEILDEKALAEQGFGAHLAVGRGSATPPRLVILEHAPKGHEDEAPIVFIGKGITFDSGGISLKPSADMHQMKGDMTGSAAVLSAVLSLAEEEVPRRIIGLLALAENMPDGNATRPGDVVQGYSHDMIEIVNTDAEGRLVLCDAIAYACRRWHPEVMVDVATLTGACMVALGDELGGLFSNDDDLANLILSAGHCAGEEYWRMPLWKGYNKKLESPIADICHTAFGRAGGAITAALFLEHFVLEGTRWAHLDIAALDWKDTPSALCDKGATGFSARTLLELGRGGAA